MNTVEQIIKGLEGKEIHVIVGDSDKYSKEDRAKQLLASLKRFGLVK